MNLLGAQRTGLQLRTQRAAQLMQRWARRTGLLSGQANQRYLFTDAMAVCTLLSFARETGEEQYLELATRLVNAVHFTLGRHREDDWREGWLSGLSERGASAHPTWGGLRIGKPLAERRWDDAPDEQLEWERDGQYLHYLTRWMHALDQLARYTQEPRYNVWARELAAVAWAAFSVQPGRTGGRQLVWKMSIDLSRPLVETMGQSDAVDGLITCVQLQATAVALHASAEGPSLTEERAGFAALAQSPSTHDPLELGSLLTHAWRVTQLQKAGARFDPGLLPSLLSSALEGLAHYAQQNALHRPALSRMAFRELGLAIGLHALERLSAREPSRDTAPLVEALSPATLLGSEIDAFWLDAAHREAASWREQLDLNEVTLATSLCPQGYLELAEVS
ncbi:MAG: hypothetical protein Q8K32_30115 [Archangium sp.]|nr:hypothetical protein [Archangium sp.]